MKNEIIGAMKNYFVTINYKTSGGREATKNETVAAINEDSACRMVSNGLRNGKSVFGGSAVEIIK